MCRTCFKLVTFQCNKTISKHNQAFLRRVLAPLFELESQLESSFPVSNWAHVRTLVAVSGGPDSVALLRAMTSNLDRFDSTLRSNLSVGHVNHQIRGIESDSDAEFVRDLAKSLKLNFVDSKPKFLDIKNGHSEESLRDFRYAELMKLTSSTAGRYLVTGHNRDDQVETILFRILRGTGISGLKGIPAKRLANESTTIVRPLLEISREQIETYLHEIGQPFRHDSSNADTKYSRNYLRHSLIPELKSRFGESISQSLLRLGEQAAENEAFLDLQSSDLDAAILESSPLRLTLHCPDLSCHSSVIIRHWLNRIWIRQRWPRQAITAEWLRRLSSAIKSDENSVLNLPNQIRFEKNDRRVVIARNGEQ